MPDPIPVVIFCSNPNLSAVLTDYLEYRDVARVEYAMCISGRLNGARKRLTAGTVAVLALRIPIAEDLDLVRCLHHEFPGVGIVVITPVCSHDYASIVKEAGAHALVDAGRLSRDLMAAVRSVAQQKRSSSK